MNAHLRSKLPLDAVEMCAHDDADNCDCRKPKPGLLLHAAERDGIDLDRKLHGGRPLARHRGGTQRRMPHHPDRRWLWRDIQGPAGRDIRHADRSRRLDSQATRESQGLIMPSVDQLKVKIFADGADKAGMLEMYKQPARQGLHHQSDADAQGRRHRLRGGREGHSRGDPGPLDLVRGVRRRLLRDGASGAAHHDLGQACLGEDSDHQHQEGKRASRWSASSRRKGSRSMSRRCSRSSRCRRWSMP